MSKLEQLKQLVTSIDAVELLAEQFCELDDDTQALFFVHVARIMRAWPRGGEMQAFYIGRHLRTCSCVTDDALELVTQIYEAMTMETA